MEAVSPYLEYFSFSEDPFSLTPNPAYFYLTREHTLALEELHRGVSERKGVVLLIGEMGTGKTILLRTLQKNLPENIRVSYQLNPSLGFTSIVKKMLSDFNLPHEIDSKAELISLSHEKLGEFGKQGIHAVLMLDEAQSLGEEVLEDIRILSNIEDDEGKLLSIILTGQPELLERISASSLKSLKHRIGVRIYLKPMESDEISMYIEHRLKVAGWSSDTPLFTKDSFTWITFSSNGNPRLINVIADNALHRAFREKVRTVDKELIRRTLSRLEGRVALGKQESKKFSLRSFSPISVALLIFLAVFSFYIVNRIRGRLDKKAERTVELSTIPETTTVLPQSSGTPVEAAQPAEGEAVTSVEIKEEETGAEISSESPQPEPAEFTADDSDTTGVEVIMKSVSPIEAVPTVEEEPVTQIITPHVTPDKEPDIRNKTGAIKGRQIVVQDDEYLYMIIKREYGFSNMKYLKMVLEVNSDIKDPDRIYPGQKIFLPEIFETE